METQIKRFRLDVVVVVVVVVVFLCRLLASDMM